MTTTTDEERLRELAQIPFYGHQEIRERRQEADLYQRELAEEMGVTRTSVEMWEKEGEHLPNPENREKLHEAFEKHGVEK